jgi:hypothetical protein
MLWDAVLPTVICSDGRKVDYFKVEVTRPLAASALQIVPEWNTVPITLMALSMHQMHQTGMITLWCNFSQKSSTVLSCILCHIKPVWSDHVMFTTVLINTKNFWQTNKAWHWIILGCFLLTQVCWQKNTLGEDDAEVFKASVQHTHDMYPTLWEPPCKLHVMKPWCHLTCWYVKGNCPTPKLVLSLNDHETWDEQQTCQYNNINECNTHLSRVVHRQLPPHSIKNTVRNKGWQ